MASLLDTLSNEVLRLLLAQNNLNITGGRDQLITHLATVSPAGALTHSRTRSSDTNPEAAKRPRLEQSGSKEQSGTESIPEAHQKYLKSPNSTVVSSLLGELWRTPGTRWRPNRGHSRFSSTPRLYHSSDFNLNNYGRETEKPYACYNYPTDRPCSSISAATDPPTATWRS